MKQRDIKLDRLMDALKKCRHICECGRNVSITSKRSFVICDNCGRRVYKNDKARFKGELGKLLKKKFV